MQFALLGPLEVRDEGRTIEIARGKPRALLALLLLSPGRVVPVERLIDELWGDAPPATVATALHVYVSGLRKALGEGTIATHEPGYVIQVAPEAVDLHHFEQLRTEARAADPERAAALLAEALAIWRGPALADVPLPREAARLEELRLGATEERIDAELELGAHEELVPELEGLVREHPFHERLRRQLMLALYRAGRQADALAAFADARRTFVDTLGVDPSPMLQELQHAILRQDVSLAPSTDRTTVATVLFLDLGVRGEVEATADRALAAAEEQLSAQHALRIEPGLADALLAVFDDATEAVGAAIAVCEHLRRELTDACRPRAGLATGDVTLGARTSGAAVVLAARRVRDAKPGEVVAGERTAAAARGAFSFRRRGDGYVVSSAV
jgi:DNA-binding SARP family transcriptional activator